MSEQDFLSQEEIDALLGGGESEAEEESSVEELSDIRPFDFDELESIKKGGFPGLELIYERWVKLFREEVRKVLPKINMVSKESIYITRFNNFMFNIPMPSSYTTFTMRPLKETALLVIDSRLVFTVISVMFGGPAKPFKVEGREFTKLETYVIKDFIDIALESLQDVFSAVYPVDVEKKSIELNPALAKITSGNEKVIISECIVDIDGFEAPIYFCFPHGMFLPIKEIIYSEFQGEVDPVWKKRVHEILLQTDVKVALELPKQTYLMKDVLQWKEGMELVLDIEKDEDAYLRISDKYKFRCKVGKIKEKYAALLKTEHQEEEAENE
ncbi:MULTISPECIES: flagellar motor switch protein FliM [unclassified Nitratiruptor]|uniref:flagellar motor switch protein FliM n=1 Tax=unclassified Nitratiruptor TaxID=2624044 RepID=UPI0019167A2D|nr:MULTISPECIES: FliM/FliN family flagellar motor switch protein [unclassified Nitratiruptor]BCD59907.1 flagellar motor switch protein FliM [Nitratiruptor sp. YY08-10]BCD63830.1 flagellar motor switch protein FliM [Nitratiruptor sp. YY08-14]